MRAIWLCAFLVACGGAAEEEPPRALHIERLALPDPSQAAFQVTVEQETVTCEQIDCALAFELPVEPVTLKVLDALGNVFNLPIDDVAEGPHVVKAPLAPAQGVFLEYTLEYSVR